MPPPVFSSSFGRWCGVSAENASGQVPNPTPFAYPAGDRSEAGDERKEGHRRRRRGVHGHAPEEQAVLVNNDGEEMIVLGVHPFLPFMARLHLKRERKG